METPTIAAIATGPAAGGIGIVRLSGPRAWGAARRVVSDLSAAPQPRVATLTRFGDANGAVLDEGLVLFFPAPNSVTGEDVVELHAHGSLRLLELLLAEVLRHEGVRLATPGEFTRRAFLSGRIDLTRAEAVADLIAAHSEGQVRAAAAQLAGGFEARVSALKQPLLALQADVEGALDFPDEAEGAEAAAEQRLGELVTSARALRADAQRGALLRRGAKVVLFGPVNAGKSTLFNALLGVDRALVDAEPGTTRDALEAQLELHGLSLTLTDTAGLRADAGRLEQKGIERARAALKAADVTVLVLPPDASASDLASWSAETDAARLLVVEGKGDLRTGSTSALRVSGTSGQGISELRAAVAQRLVGDVASSVVAASERHLAALSTIEEALVRAHAASSGSTLEVVAGEVGIALEAVSELLGTDARTELLDAVFARFCIGK